VTYMHLSLYLAPKALVVLGVAKTRSLLFTESD
jgi:hypothetical protein